MVGSSHLFASNTVTWLIPQSWSMDPSQRPSFARAYERLVGLVPAIVEARQRCQSEGKLAVDVGDTIAVVDGRFDGKAWMWLLFSPWAVCLISKSILKMHGHCHLCMNFDVIWLK